MSDNMIQEKLVLSEICAVFSHTVSYSDAKSALLDLQDKISCHQDFMFDFDGNEYRIIHEDAIWDIYVEEIKQTVEDCYELKLDDFPPFVAFEIDWVQTAKNCLDDGYGMTFSSYDHSENSAGAYYIFRTN